MEWVERHGRPALRVGAGSHPVYPAASLVEGIPPVPTVLQPMAGRYLAEPDGAVVFVPAYPFVAGTEYAVVVRQGEDTLVERIRLEAEASEPTTSVVAIRPALDEVPRNLLRLYVEFSAPMGEGYASSHISLVDLDAGQPLVNPLLPFEPELWDPPRRRLTVLLDPGRIKRGLAPHLDAGYPLVAGQRVGLVVDAGFRDAAGRPMVDRGLSTFVVGPDLRGLVDPRRWTISPPKSATKAPLEVAFDRPLDVALLAHCLVVLDGDGGIIGGHGDAAADGRAWRFEPAETWRAGRHVLLVDPILEDVAGNSVRRPFDRDLDDAADAPRSEDGPVLVDVLIG